VHGVYLRNSNGIFIIIIKNNFISIWKVHLAIGRKDLAMQTLEKIAIENKTSLPDGILIAPKVTIKIHRVKHIEI
jgi:hypothetical protein